MTVTTVALLLVSIGFVAYELFTFQQRMRHDLAAQGQMIGELSVAALNHTNSVEAGKILAVLETREHVKVAAIYNGNRAVP